MKEIKIKSTGTEVKIIQIYLGVGADGIFGPKTEAAVNKWKASLGMAADGKITEADWNIIAKSMPTIRKGDKGNNVKIWQLFLGIAADGNFGAGTKASTRTFQAGANLTVDGVVGQKSWLAAFTEQRQEETNKKNKQPVNYKQYDSRWGSVVYTKNNTYNKKQTIKSSGCGPTSIADIVATWWDKKVTPVEMCALSVKNGYRTDNSGTSWGFFKFVANKYGASKFIKTNSVATLKSSLEQGAYAVVSFAPSKWTKSGHFCCIWAWDGKYFYINDPASASAARAKGTEKEVTAAKKQFFIFFK